MKVTNYLLLAIFFLLSCTKTNSKPENFNASAKTLGKINNNETPAYFRGYSKASQCQKNRGHCMLAMTAKISGQEKENSWPIVITLENSQLKVANTSLLKSDDDIVNIPSNGFKLPDDISRQLGKSFIEILPGKYTVKFDDNLFGTVIFEVVTRR